MRSFEINFDGLVGPTHNYAGLAFGNVASMRHGAETSSPRLAALQGLRKMKLLHDLGLPQGFFPPQERPLLPLLRSFGFEGSDAEVISNAHRKAPKLFLAASSASGMWAANSATVTASCDSYDERVHFTVANLLNRFHRSIEGDATYAMLKHIFPEPFSIHPPLFRGGRMGDEGAANSSRFCKDYSSRGVYLFTYGDEAFSEHRPISRFPLRQSKEAIEAICRRHKLSDEQVVIAKMDSDLIDEGVFHADVIAVCNQNLFLYHERAFSQEVIDEIEHKLHTATGASLQKIPISDLSVQQAVSTYFFNSQLLTLPDGRKLLLAPEESKGLSLHLPGIDSVEYINLRESMRNGGGPACLRLRVVLNEKEMSEVNPHFILTESLYKQLTAWVNKHYRDELNPADLADPLFLRETYAALDELTRLLHMGPFYPFQQQ